MDVDLATGVLTKAVPFDVPFLIKGTTGKTLPAELTCVQTTITVQGEDPAPHRDSLWQPIAGSTPDAFYVLVDPVAPNREVTLQFTLHRKLPKESLAAIKVALATEVLQTDAPLSSSTTLATFQDATQEAFGPGVFIEENPCAAPAAIARLQAIAQAGRGKWDAAHKTFRSAEAQAVQFLADIPSFKGSSPEAQDALRMALAGEAVWDDKGLRPLDLPSLQPGVGVEAYDRRIEALQKSAQSLKDALLKAGLEESRVQADQSEEVLAVALDALQRMKQAEVDSAAQVGAWVDLFGFDAYSEVVTVGGSAEPLKYKDRASTYISMDVGLAFFPMLEDTYAAPYVGANFYLRPVNKESRLSEGGFWPSMGRRFSLLAGTSVTSIAREGRRKGLFGDSGLLLGAGFRVVSSVRLNGGAVLFLRVDPDPLVAGTSLAASPFVSASLDIDIAGLLAGVGKKVFGL